MRLKKWLLIFCLTLAACVLLFAGYNVVLDPFGVFGDRVLDWYEYDMTMNPRVAKLAYLDRHWEEYDSYVIGSSRISSLPAEALNAYTGAKFYNMTWYGGDLADERDMVNYVLENYHVENIILAIDPQNADIFDTVADPIKGNMHWKADGSSPLAFYFKYLFANPQYGWDKLMAYRQRGYLMTADAVYVAETGTYNKQLRDAVPIGELSEYLARENNIIGEAYSDLSHLYEAVEAVADIKAACEAHGVNLTVIGVPMHDDDFYRYDQERMSLFWRELAGVTDFYDFWGSGQVNSDMRYYYDTEHFRNNVGAMVLAYLFDDPDVYIPEGFGHLTTPDTVEERIAETYPAQATDPATYTVQVPILMYHAFTEDPAAAASATAYIEDFREHMAALAEGGWTPVLYRDLLDYVYHGVDLPEKPIVITMDDGYQSDLDLALPILEEHGFPATIAVIGCSIGKTTYKDTDTPILPHFSLADVKPYVEAGVLDVQTHSYDMHQVQSLDGEDCRRGVLRMDGESEADYVAALTADFLRAKEELEPALGVTCNIFTYPYGYHDTLSEVVLQSLGVQVTVTTVTGVNTVIKGVPQSLYALKRIDVYGGMTTETLLGYLAP